MWTCHPCFTAQRASKPCPGCRGAVNHCGRICAALSSCKQTFVCVHYVSFIFNVRFWKISWSYIWKTTNHCISKLHSLSFDADVPLWNIRTSGKDTGITLCLPTSLPNHSGLSPTTELLGWDWTVLHMQGSDQVGLQGKYSFPSGFPTRCSYSEMKSSYWDYEESIPYGLLIHSTVDILWCVYLLLLITISGAYYSHWLQV